METITALRIEQRVPGPPNPWNKYCAANYCDPNRVQAGVAHRSVTVVGRGAILYDSHRHVDKHRQGASSVESLHAPMTFPYARLSKEDPAKSGLESKRTLTVEGGFS